MKKIVYSAVAFVLLTGTTFADEGADKVDKIKERRFKMMDVDNDGKITPAEHTKYREKRFKQLDKNGDGVLDQKEWAVSTFDRADKNKDKKVDPDEFHVMGKRRFKVLDANKDGHLSFEEFMK